MRVISGQYKRRKLFETSTDKTRSTKDRVKETLFNMLSTRLMQAKTLDLFAGSGALGIEALSRGAERADLIENDKEAFSVMRKNIETLKISDANLYYQNAFTFLTSTTNTYDVIILDPPYHTDYLDKALTLIAERKLLQSGGVMVSLSHKTKAIALPDAISVVKERIEGITTITFYEWSE